MGDEQAARVLGVMGVAGPVVVVVPSQQEAEQGRSELGVFTDLSGSPGIVVFLQPGREENSPLLAALEEAALIVMADCGPAESLREALEESEASDMLLEALRSGCVILAEGAAAEVLGQFTGSEELVPGLGWLPGAVVQAHHLPDRPCPALSRRSHLYRLGLVEESVLALGPGGAVELWGGPSPVVTFGTGWLK
ncbi:MAG: hypothetical protein ABSG98_07190 [Anaerolineales bacterium]